MAETLENAHKAIEVETNKPCGNCNEGNLYIQYTGSFIKRLGDMFGEPFMVVYCKKCNGEK